MKVPDIIDLLGGVAPISAALAIHPNTVSNWKARESIPARYHSDVLRFGGGKITAEQLVQAHAPTHATEAA